MAEVTIRHAEEADCGCLAALLMEAFAFYGDQGPCPAHELVQRLRRSINRNPGYHALIAQLDGADVGFAIYAPVFWTSDCEIALFLKEIFVNNSLRGHGIGSILMQALAREAEVRGWTRLVWTVDRRNFPAIEFYKKIPGARETKKDVFMLDGEALSAFSKKA